MRFDDLSRYMTGVLVPLSALRTEAGPGVGEFADLPLLAQWCKAAGLDLIQLLPVNDTGSESSPYSALSVFALHPMYLRISDLPEYRNLDGAERESVTRELEAIRATHAGSSRIRYGELLRAKLQVTHAVFSAARRTAAPEAVLEQFMSTNPWVRPYATFKLLKEQNDQRPWKEWEQYRDPTAADMEAIWSLDANRRTLFFHVWLQMRLEEQFLAAVRAVDALGIMLKGDLPIMANEDSVDVWSTRDAFITRLRAGAPPDMFSHLGQYWDFPIYDWGHLAQTGYHWWKDRLAQAEKYYAAYRIDHVLGFFRVWAISALNSSGLLGHFYPSATASRDRLHEAGLDDARIRWLAEPHVTGREIREVAAGAASSGREPAHGASADGLASDDPSDDPSSNGGSGVQASAVIDAAFTRIGDEDLFLFADGIRGERDIRELPFSEEIREWLVSRYRDRALVRLEHDRFAPAWSYRSCGRYQELGEHEKESFERLVDELGQQSEEIWEEQGRKILGFMRDASEMLPCAEDLGVIPNCVPRVLHDLGILGLRIPRWARLWDQPGQPYIPPNEFPFQSVCVPSVHDTSTMRGWWRENDDKFPFWKSLGLSGKPPREYDAETARLVTDAVMQTSSAICVLQMQDYLALCGDLTPGDPDDERVNIPGIVNDTNWNYRVPFTLEELLGHADLARTIMQMTERRRARPVNVPDEGVRSC